MKNRSQYFNICNFITLFLFVLFAIVMNSCTNNVDKRPSGNPSEILPADLYNKIQLKYNDIQNFEQGSAIVKNVKYGLIDYKGKEICPCIYDSIYPLYKSKRFVLQNKKFGLVDIAGKIFKECIYDDFFEKFPKVIPLKLNGKWGFLDEKGNISIQFKYDNLHVVTDSFFVAKYNNKWGISDYDDNILISFSYDYITVIDNIKFLKQNNRYGIANSQNKIITDCIYDNTRLPKNGYVVLRKNKSPNYKTTKYGLVNCETGEETIPFVYDDLGDYCDGLIMAEQNDKCGYIDINNNVVIPFIYNRGDDFSEGLALVLKTTGYANTRFGVQPVKKGGYINKKGEVVIPFSFAEDAYLGNSIFSEGLAAVGIAKNNLFAQRYGYINKNGEFVIKPIFDEAEPFSGGIAQVKIEEKIGFINYNGDFVIPCIYDERDFWVHNRDNTICLIKDNINYYFDFKGNKVSI